MKMMMKLLRMKGMMMNSPEIFVRYRPERQCIDLIIREEESDGTFAYAYGMNFAKPSNNEAPIAVSLSEIEAQVFMDRLWSCGLRPSKRYNVLSAVQNHLNDMRRIVFQEL